MGKKVKVVTACGDTHFYDFKQEVKSVEIVEKEENLTLVNQGDHWHLMTPTGYIAVNIWISGKDVRMITMGGSRSWNLKVNDKKVET